METYQHSRRILTAIGDKFNLARNSHNLGNVYQALGEIEKALEAYGQALEVYLTMGYAPGAARTLHQIGCACEAHGAADEASRHFERSLKLFERLANPVGVAGNLLALARVRPTQREKLNSRALAELEGIDAAPERVAALVGQARIHLIPPEGG